MLAGRGRSGALWFLEEGGRGSGKAGGSSGVTRLDVVLIEGRAVLGYPQGDDPLPEGGLILGTDVLDVLGPFDL